MKEGIRRFASVSTTFGRVGRIQRGNPGLVVHPLNEFKFWEGGDAEAARLPMTPPPAPDEGVPVLVPVGGGPRDGGFDLGPSLEATAFERQ